VIVGVLLVSAILGAGPTPTAAIIAKPEDQINGIPKSLERSLSIPSGSLIFTDEEYVLAKIKTWKYLDRLC
jgi:hypothetical protein